MLTHHQLALNNQSAMEREHDFGEITGHAHA